MAFEQVQAPQQFEEVVGALGMPVQGLRYLGGGEVLLQAIEQAVCQRQLQGVGRQPSQLQVPTGLQGVGGGGVRVAGAGCKSGHGNFL